jgi:excisionase family DNA binding protein
VKRTDDQERLEMSRQTADLKPLGVSRQDAANMLGISVDTLDRRIADRTIRPARIGTRVVIPITEIERLIEPDNAA